MHVFFCQCRHILKFKINPSLVPKSKSTYLENPGVFLKSSVSFNQAAGWRNLGTRGHHTGKGLDFRWSDFHNFVLKWFKNIVQYNSYNHDTYWQHGFRLEKENCHMSLNAIDFTDLQIYFFSTKTCLSCFFQWNFDTTTSTTWDQPLAAPCWNNGFGNDGRRVGP